MSKNRLFYILCFVCMLFVSCVSKGKYLELEKDLQNTQQSLEQEKMSLADLQDKYNNLEKVSRDLNLDLEKERAAVEQKTKIISGLEETRIKIEEGLKEQIANQQIKIEDIEGKLKLTFVDKILFNSGSTEINEVGKETLSTFAESIQEDKDHNILVEGHTDNVGVGPILKNIFPSNWELSTARSSAVVRFLQNEGGIEPERLSAIGYSYYKPVAPNDDEGRSQNRRIEIILTRSR